MKTAKQLRAMNDKYDSIKRSPSFGFKLQIITF